MIHTERAPEDTWSGDSVLVAVLRPHNHRVMELLCAHQKQGKLFYRNIETH